MTPEEKEEKIQEEIKRMAEDKMKTMADRHDVYKYVVGVYAGKEYHLQTLRRIYRYYHNAAYQGDPVAQYHLALFLRYLGDIVDPDAEAGAHEYESLELRNLASASDLTKRRVEELGRQLAEGEKKAEIRARAQKMRVEALWQVESDRLDMMDDVLIRVRERLSSSGGGGGGPGGPPGGGGPGGPPGGVGGPPGGGGPGGPPGGMGGPPGGMGGPPGRGRGR
jgi:hypothetical protein